eukprot:NODE_22538_length_704_cov_2.485269.p1 GENE.NODE_22538_length_704_cov_2.485269~~NODE_22538_length_704_cov_2.485269.p1  ORF type:complete len:89 (-),score=13.56 NODE_22538_length_704_cov_2.485269:70-336(-)
MMTALAFLDLPYVFFGVCATAMSISGTGLRLRFIAMACGYFGGFAVWHRSPAAPWHIPGTWGSHDDFHAIILLFDCVNYLFLHAQGVL